MTRAGIGSIGTGGGGYKPRRAGNGDSSGYAGAANRSQKDVSSGSPSQPKMIFNEDEYMRITTPRQDMLLKKGYLSRKKPWTGNASTSATPSTTESQSASHSTAGRGIGRSVTHFIEFLLILSTCLPSRPNWPLGDLGVVAGTPFVGAKKSSRGFFCDG